MTRKDKLDLINTLKDKLSETDAIYLADISGLNAQKTVALRRACFKADVKLMVVKNTLLAKAMEDTDKDFGELPTTLQGNTSIFLSETGNSPAKIMKEFRKKNEKPVLKGAYIDEAIYMGDQQIEPLANLKSKEEVIGDIVTILQSPAKNVISALQSGGSKLSGILETLSEKEE
ncbi:MAG: 50S ribosomal protein L10 [Psychroflexus sp.]|jgi:large subunit ribosomal protein L10|nr:50S ribosomal protein L10 [Psychroflexus sp.]MDR9447813.1 50S ribosomal protein L10 [Psychroflexus sp.]